MSTAEPAAGASTAPLGARKLLDRHGLRPRKSLGQNFLVNRGALARIVAVADVARDDVVIEVGPGAGALTIALAAKARQVIAVEKDARLAEALRIELEGHPGIIIVEGDMLELTPEALLRAHGGTNRYKVVANLPYYAANPILRKFLEAEAKPELLVVLLQREVARSIAAKPGDMSLLSVAVQLFARPTIAGIVRPGSFYPPPKVDSAIVRLDVRPVPAVVAPGETQGLIDVARAGFSARRKQLANSLSHALEMPRDEVAAGLTRAGVAPQRRAETLSLEEWGAVYRELGHVRR